jgi:hypothetical protein
MKKKASFKPNTINYKPFGILRNLGHQGIEIRYYWM